MRSNWFDKVATGHVDSCCEFLKWKWRMDKMNEIYLGEAFLGKKTFNLLSIFEARKRA